ncbi:MAG: histidine kinase [Sphingomonas bacterium]|nr:histidine kinase [Sphingomonas bacterium]
MLAQSHPRQTERLDALRRYAILDTPREAEFDDLVALVAEICEVPVAVVNFIDADRQWFKAEVGLGVRSTPLATSLCSHVILEHAFVEIPDTLTDPRMSDNPLCVAEGGFRFYAGTLLETPEGLPLGTLCVLDVKPRTLTPVQRNAMSTLAARVMSELNLRLSLKVQDVLRREIDHRVKNSLASIAAVIQLQSARSDSADAQGALAAVGSRLTALSALHEEMQLSSDGESVDAAKLIERAVAKLSLIVGEKVGFALDLAPTMVPSDHANAIALIVNEFVTNSARHGFGDSAGTIAITLRGRAGGYALTLSDDGRADAQAVERVERNQGLGSRVVGSLARTIGAAPRWSTAEPGLRLVLDAQLDRA